MEKNLPLNAFGDVVKNCLNGYGNDISSQRLDKLDRRALSRILEIADQMPTVHFLEIGCGMGWQSYRAAMLGACVQMNDIVPVSTLPLFKQLFTTAQIEFLHGSALSLHLNADSYDIVYSQRVLHYFKYKDAVTLAAKIRSIGKPGMRLYVSASGINSELGEKYPGKAYDIQERFCHLSPQMLRKHNIHQNVCLYSLQELINLFESNGFVVIDSFESQFGNVKAEFFLKP